MLIEHLKPQLDTLRSKGVRADYLVNTIKEYLQLLVLNYIYNNKEYNQKLIFTGGTCLRICFGLPRLSEDIDFDYEGSLDVTKLKTDIENHFISSLKISDVTSVIKGKNEKIYLKFPILKKFNLAYGNSEILYLKIETSPEPGAPKQLEIAPISKEGLYFFIKRYSLPDLMCGKICAFLMRSFFKGKQNEIEFKGRDVFDLIWYMGQNTKPNFERLNKLLCGTPYEGHTWTELMENIDKKMQSLKKQHLILDLQQFIEDPVMLSNFMDNYLKIFEQYRNTQ